LTSLLSIAAIIGASGLMAGKMRQTRDCREAPPAPRRVVDLDSERRWKHGLPTTKIYTKKRPNKLPVKRPNKLPVPQFGHRIVNPLCVPKTSSALIRLGNSSNFGRDGPVNFVVLEPVCDSLQVQEPT
jgi:hypothetical protein